MKVLPQEYSIAVYFLRGQLVEYLTNNKDYVQQSIANILDSEKTYNEKVEMIKTFMATSLQQIVLPLFIMFTGSMTLPTEVSDAINNFASDYSKVIAKEADDYLATTVSTGDLLFIILCAAEAAVIVLLAVVLYKAKKKASEKISK